MMKHILIVTIDTLRADYVGCYGRREISTPNLDRFAAEGARFGQHLTSVSATLTSHCSLMTGCTPSVNGINWNGVTHPRRRKTAAEIVNEVGYSTSAITSWGGFQNQQVYGFENVHSEGGAASEENRGDHTIRRILDWLDEVDASRPQLLWVHFIDPHTPDNCPEPFPQTYEGEVEFSDTLVGQLLDGWDEKLGAADSVAVITADHGEHLNDHGVERGHGTLWLTNLWVPLLMRAPSLVAPGAVVPELTRQIDVLPTVLDYCDIPMPHNMEGMSLRNLIEGTDRDLGLFHCGQAIYDDNHTVTLRNAEYAFHFGDGKNLVHAFDLRSDPGENEDLWNGDSHARYSVDHSVKDGQEK
jgi:arylsulfatase A-like enzyme